MHDIEVISDPRAAEIALDATRARLLAELVEPASATALAHQLGLPRQKVNYHLRALEEHGLVELVEERRRGNCTERVLQATARAYVVSPDALASSSTPPPPADQLSARWLLALGTRLVRDVGVLLAKARGPERAVGTFAVDGEVRFGSAADRAAFTAELSAALTDLVGRYHDENAPRGRRHRLVLALHPAVDSAPSHSQEAAP